MDVERAGARDIAGLDDTDGMRMEQQTECIVQGCYIETYNDDRLELEVANTDNGAIELGPLPRDVARDRPLEYREYVDVGRKLKLTASFFRKHKVRYQVQETVREMRMRRNLQLGDAYEALQGVIQGLFEDAIDMEGIVTMLMFGYEFARDLLKKALGDHMCDVIALLVRFIHTEEIMVKGAQAGQTIADWISSNGGWLQVFSVFAQSEEAVAVSRQALKSLVAWDVLGFTAVNFLMIYGLMLRRK